MSDTFALGEDSSHFLIRDGFDRIKEDYTSSASLLMPSQNLSTFGFVMTFLILTLLVGMHSLFVTVHLVGILSLEAA